MDNLTITSSMQEQSSNSNDNTSVNNTPVFPVVASENKSSSTTNNLDTTMFTSAASTSPFTNDVNTSPKPSTIAQTIDNEPGVVTVIIDGKPVNMSARDYNRRKLKKMWTPLLFGALAFIILVVLLPGVLGTVIAAVGALVTCSTVASLPAYMYDKVVTPEDLMAQKIVDNTTSLMDKVTHYRNLVQDEDIRRELARINRNLSAVVEAVCKDTGKAKVLGEWLDNEPYLGIDNLEHYCAYEKDKLESGTVNDKLVLRQHTDRVLNNIKWIADNTESLKVDVVYR